MWNTIKRIIEFIKFVIGSVLIGVGVIVGGIVKFVAYISYHAVRLGIIMASDLRSRYLDMNGPEINYDSTELITVVPRKEL